VDNVLLNTDELGSSYNGFELTFDKRMANNFMVFGGITLGAFKECASGAASTNPNQRINACGYSAFDSRVMTNLSAIYRLPYGFSVSSHFKHASGRPTSRDFLVTRALVPNLTQVNERVILQPSGDVRLPTWTLWDLRISKVASAGRLKVEPLLDVYNLLNENAALTEVRTVGPTLGRISANIEGRLVKVGMKVSF
jgi:hypothetical protein